MLVRSRYKNYSVDLTKIMTSVLKHIIERALLRQRQQKWNFIGSIKISIYGTTGWTALDCTAVSNKVAAECIYTLPSVIKA